MLEAQGGTVVFQPVIEILPVEDDRAIRQYISRMTFSGLNQLGVTESDRSVQFRPGNNAFDWLLFSSVNGVNYFMNYFEGTEPFCPPDNRVGLAAIGPGTEAALRRWGLAVDIVSEWHQAEGLVEALQDQARKGKRFLSVRGSRGRKLLTTELTRLGGYVEEVVVYRSVDVTKAETNVQNMLQTGKIDIVTATSSSIARSLIDLFGEGLRTSRIVTISPLTTQVFLDAGFLVSGQARHATIPSLVECVAAID